MMSQTMLENPAGIRPETDPWDPIHSLRKYGRYTLTSIEVTVTNLCNMRCEHCAVGDALSLTEGAKLPLDLLLTRLDEIETLETISITGGEPMFDKKNIREYILPLLKYAKDRGLKSQLNSNLTLGYERYEEIAPFLDVLHISYNYTDAKDFLDVGFVRTSKGAPSRNAQRLFENMVENTRKLTKNGLFVSAESMINYRTYNKMKEIHRQIIDMGCQRHEVHPMYPSAFAANLPMLSAYETRQTIHSLLDARDPRVWMLFGTLPFYPCSQDDEDQKLLTRMRSEPNLTIRNDPDGRNRLNVNLFTGNIYVTDFSDLSSIGNINRQRLDDVFAQWLQHKYHHLVNCYCAEASCCGPNLLVKDMYYKEVDFHTRKAIMY